MEFDDPLNKDWNWTIDDMQLAFRDFKEFSGYESDFDYKGYKYHDCVEPKTDFYKENSIQRWIKYQKGDYDCDGSKSSNAQYLKSEEKTSYASLLLYSKLWPNTKLEYNLPCKRGRRRWFRYWEIYSDYCPDISGDTMNSFKTLYNQVYIDKGYDDDSSARYLMEQFAHLTHTLGNFIPCPNYFNQERSHTSKDFWDLTLEEIYDNYCYSNYKLSKKYPNINKWLNENHSSWKDFITKNYLEDWVDNDFEIVKLFQDHSFNNTIPMDYDSFIECIQNINERIIKRSVRLLQRIKQNNLLNDDELYLFIRKKEFVFDKL